MSIWAMRREERVPFRIPVQIHGMDAERNLFEVPAFATNVSLTGACLERIARELRPGNVIGIEHAKRRASFRVAWSGLPGTVTEGQVGIHCLEPARDIWRFGPKGLADDF